MLTEAANAKIALLASQGKTLSLLAVDGKLAGMVAGGRYG